MPRKPTLPHQERPRRHLPSPAACPGTPAARARPSGLPGCGMTWPGCEGPRSCATRCRRRSCFPASVVAATCAWGAARLLRGAGGPGPYVGPVGAFGPLWARLRSVAGPPRAISARCPPAVFGNAAGPGPFGSRPLFAPPRPAGRGAAGRPPRCASARPPAPRAAASGGLVVVTHSGGGAGFPPGPPVGLRPVGSAWSAALPLLRPPSGPWSARLPPGLSAARLRAGGPPGGGRPAASLGRLCRRGAPGLWPPASGRCPPRFDAIRQT